MFRFIDKSYRAVRDYGFAEFLKRLFVFFDRRIRPAMYYHMPGSFTASVESKKRILFVSGEPKNATSYYRCEIPANQLKAQGWEVDIVFEEFVDQVEVKNYTVVILYRTPFVVVEGILEKAKEQGVKTVFSVDDFVYRRDLVEKLDYTKTLYPADAERLLDRADGMLELMKKVDAGIASTEYLAKDMHKYIKGEVFVNRNGIGNIVEVDERTSKNNSEKVVLGYFSGSETHDRDFEMIWSAVERTLRENDNVGLWLGGRIEARKFKNGDLDSRIKQLPFMNREKYMKTLAKVDISLFPLEDTEFNRGKSEIKFLEAGQMGTPAVVSPVGDMAELIQDGENGLLASDIGEWDQKLQKLIDGVSFREEVGKNAQKYVRKNYSLERLGEAFSQFLGGLVTA
ncbi:glycosyltransferase [Candidatus Dojkabacteria bacterium]|nr:glycosyltransferase [Candidatus Dojkabacteria bacterium]